MMCHIGAFLQEGHQLTVQILQGGASKLNMDISKQGQHM